MNLADLHDVEIMYDFLRAEGMSSESASMHIVQVAKTGLDCWFRLRYQAYEWNKKIIMDNGGVTV